jgi:hypothetical protein
MTNWKWVAVCGTADQVAEELTRIYLGPHHRRSVLDSNGSMRCTAPAADPHGQITIFVLVDEATA